MSQFNIPVEVQAKFKQNPDLMNQFVSEVAKGSKAAREEFLKITNQEYKVQMVAEFNNSGQVSTKIKKINGDIDGLEKAWKKETRAQQGSVTSLTKRLSNLKQQQSAIKRLDETTGKLNKRWLVYQRRINAANVALAKQKGGFQGLLAGMGKLGAGVSSVAKFVPVIGKVMFAVQGLQQAFELVSMAVGKFVARQKAIQGFQMAMEGFGMDVEEANGLLDAAAGIGMKYGQSIQGIEKGLKRITPTMVAMGGSSEDAEAVMSTLAARMATLGLNSEQSGRYMEAFAQVMGKGKLQGEELNQQFAELDGSLRPAVAEFIKAEYGITDLDGAMQKGEITAKMFAEAMVASSADMREKLGGAVDNIQEKLGKFNIQQMQNIIDNLNTKSIEEIGRQFNAVGKVVISVQTTFAQFFNSIVTQGSTSGEFVSATLTLIGGALAFVGDVAMITIKGLLNLVEGFLRLGKAIGEFIYNIPGLKQAFDFIGKIAGDGAGTWGQWKEYIFASNAEMREANEVLTLGAGKLQDYSVSAGSAGSGVKELGTSTAQLNPEITNLANEVLNAGTATASMTAETKKLVEAHVNQTTALQNLIATARGATGEMEMQVQSIQQLASGFNAARDSEEAFKNVSKGVSDNLSATTQALQAQLVSLQQRAALGEDLTAADKESLATLPDLIDQYRGLTAQIETANGVVESMVARFNDATIAVKEQVAAIDSNIQSMTNMVGPTGAFSQEEANLAVAARAASEAIQGQINVLKSANNSIISAAGGTSNLTKAQSEQISKNNDLAQKLQNTAKGYDDLATKSTRVVSATGQLNPALKSAIASYQDLANKKGKTAKESREVETRFKALSGIISGELSAAQSAYNALIAKQIQQNGSLDDSDRARLASLKSVIDELKKAGSQIDKNKDSTDAHAGSINTITDEYRSYAKALKDQNVQMDFAIQQAQRASSPVGALAKSYGTLSGQINGVSVSSKQMKTAIDAQISALEGFVQNLINAKVAGWELTKQQQTQLKVATDLIAKLREQSAALKGVKSGTDEAASSARSFSVEFINMPKLMKNLNEEMKYGEAAAGGYGTQLAKLQVAKAASGEVARLITEMKQAKLAMDNASGAATNSGEAFKNASTKYNDLKAKAEKLTDVMADATEGFQNATREGDTYVQGLKSVTKMVGLGTLEFSGLHNQVETTTNRLRDAIESLDSAKTSTANANTATGSLTRTQGDLGGAVKDATDALNAQKSALDAVQTALESIDAAAGKTAQNMSAAMRAITSAISETSEQQSRLAAAEDRASTAKSALATIEKEIQDLQAQGIPITQALANARALASNEAMAAAQELIDAKDEALEAEREAAAEEAKMASDRESAADQSMTTASKVTSNYISNNEQRYRSTASLSAKLGDLSQQAAKVRQQIAAQEEKYKNALRNGSSKREIQAIRARLNTLKTVQAEIMSRERGTQAEIRALGDQTLKHSEGLRSGDLKGVTDHAQKVLVIKERLEDSKRRLADKTAEHEALLRSGATADAIRSSEKILKALADETTVITRELEKQGGAHGTMNDQITKSDRERFADVQRMRERDAKRSAAARAARLEAIEEANKKELELEQKKQEDAEKFTGIRTASNDDDLENAEELEDATKGTAKATRTLSEYQKMYKDQLEEAQGIMKGIAGIVEREVVDGMETTTRYSYDWGTGISQASQQLSESLSLLQMSNALEKQALGLALQKGQISKSRHDSEVQQLELVTMATMKNGTIAISNARRELKSIEQKKAAKQAAFASEMLQREDILAMIEQEAKKEELVISRIEEGISAVARRRMSELDYELEKTKQIANERIAELEKLTPAEQRLAKLREKELRARANDNSLSAQERLEAKAQLERLKRNKEIAKEREKVSEIEEKMKKLQDERTLSEKKAAAAKASAEYAYQKSVLKFQNIYFQKTRALFEYQIEAKRRLAGIESGMVSEIIDGEKSRSGLNDFMNRANKEARDVMNNLDSSLDNLSQTVASAIGQAGQDISELVEKGGTDELKAVQEMQKAISRNAQETARQNRSDALRLGSTRLNISQTIREYEVATAEKVSDIYSNIQIGSSARSSGSGSRRNFSGFGPGALPARAEGGPVSGGTAYQVNELGQEGFLSASGAMRDIKAPAFGAWKAPSAGTVIPAHIWSELKASRPTHAAPGAGFNSSNTQTSQTALIAALSGLAGGSKDNITNNVTIQSETPVQAASDMLVQMTKIRRRRYR